MPALTDPELPARYLRWINRNVRRSTCEGECAEISLAMATAFPELLLVEGFYLHGPWTATHWWCVDNQGRIVDPTRYQFKDKGRGRYVPTEAS